MYVNNVNVDFNKNRCSAGGFITELKKKKSTSTHWLKLLELIPSSVTLTDWSTVHVNTALSPDGILYCRVTPSINLPVPIYTPVWGETL